MGLVGFDWIGLGCLTATIWGSDQWKHHIWIACEIQSLFDVIHDLIIHHGYVTPYIHTSQYSTHTNSVN